MERHKTSDGGGPGTFAITLLLSLAGLSVPQGAQAQATIDICDRTPQIEAEILKAVVRNDFVSNTKLDCSNVTPAELAEIRSLALNNDDDDDGFPVALKDGDFDDLTGLEFLDLTHSVSSLPSGVFSDLTSLEELDLDDNSLSSLPVGVFDGLASLTRLDLDDNSLSSLPVGVFDGLTRLTRLDLQNNSLSSLSAGVFSGLTSLEELYLRGNGLSSLPAGVFDGLTSLQVLYLSENGLSSLPAEVFDDLTRLNSLFLGENSLSSLPTGIFDGLTRLNHLSLQKSGLHSLPAGVFDKLTRLTILYLNLNPDLACIPSIPSSVTVLKLNEARDYPACVGVSIAESRNFTSVTEAAGADNTDSYTVALGSAPAGDVRITVASDDVTAATVSPATLTFTASNWATRQTVTVTGVDDRVDQINNRSATISHTAASTDSDYNGFLISDVTVTVLDANGAGVTITESNGATSVSEAAGAGHTDTYTVTLDTQPLARVSIILADLSEILFGVPAAATVSPATLTFTASNWNTGQTVTVTGVDDGLYQKDDRRATITHTIISSDPNYDAIIIPDVIATVVDDEIIINICDRTPQIKAKILRALGKTEADCGTIISTELAGITTLAVREDQSLTTLKDGDFDNLIGLTHLDLSDNSISSVPAGLFDDLTSLRLLYLLGNNLSSVPAGLFDDLTSLRWLSLSQNSLSSLPADIFDNLTRLTHLYLYDNDLSSVPTGLFDDLTRLVYLNLNNNDLSSVPAGLFDDLTRLAHLSLNNNDLSILPAGLFDDLTRLAYLDLSDNDLSILPAGIFDDLTRLAHLDLSDNDLVCLPSIPSSVTEYTGQDLPACVARVIITESGNATLVSEASGADHTDTYTVALSNQPTGSVSIAVASGTPAAATVSPATLTFTAANWNTMQTVTVTGVDDSAHQSSNRSVTISHTATSSDPDYSGITIPDVTVTVVDDDGAGVTLIESGGATAVTEAAGRGNTDSYTVALNAAPTADIEITIASGDTGAATVSPATLTFTLSNWNTGQTVTVTGVDDSLDQSSDRSVTISHRATSRDTGYSDIPIRDVTVTVVDNDRPGVTIIESDGVTSVTEAAGATNTDTYTVVLDLEPTASVTIESFVDVPSTSQDRNNSGDEFLVTVSPTILTFTTSNWNTAQTVTVTGVDNNMDQGKDNKVNIMNYTSSTDPNYDDPTFISVKVTVVDDDTAGVIINESGGATSVTEAPGAGSTDTYTVALTSEPTANVSIAAVSDGTGAVMVNSAPFIFTPSTWSIPQTVTVTGVDDHVDQSGNRTVTIAHNASSTDTAYHGISILSVSATVVDDDTAGVTMVESDGFTAVSEVDGADHTDTYTVALTSEPTHGVTVEVVPDTLGWALVNGPDGGADTTARLTFTPFTWTIPQTVTVTGVDDNLDQDSNRIVTITHGASSTDPAYQGISIPSVGATVVDDSDGAGVRIIQSGGATSVTEEAGAGQTDSYTVVLTREPTHEVTLTINSGTPGAALVNGPDETAGFTSLLTFTPSTWAAPQTVTVSGVDDNLDQSSNRIVTITHGASSADPLYQGISIPSVSATVVDDENAVPAPTVVSVTVGNGVSVAEGDSVTFTFSATPAPEPGSTMGVTFTVTGQPFRKRTSGGALVGTHSVTIDDSGAAQFTVSTLDNSLSEGKVKITATVDAGAGYRPHPRHGAASVTVVDGHPGLMVSADSLRVEEGGSVSYTMALATEPMGEVTVSISGGEGSSVTAAPTRLTFTQGNWNRPQSVSIRAAEPSPAMGVPVTLSHRASGADYEGLTAEVVVNVAADDSVEKKAKKGWHLRLGRTVSHQVVDALQDRLAARPTAGVQVTVAGEAVTNAPPLVENEGLLSKALGFETVSPEALVQGSSFSFAPEGEGSQPQVALWGQGALSSSFRGEEEDISLDGDVTTLLLGADWTGRRWQAGAALSQSWGHGSYEEDNDREGEITSTVTGVFPYGRYALTPRLGLWATAGYGWGQLTLKPDATEDEYKPGTTMTMAALGMDGLLRDGGSEGITLRGTADVLTAKTTSEEVEGLASSEGSLSRLRLGVEAVRAFPLSNGASLLPTMALGIRQDGGDAESGFGMDLGAGILWRSPKHGISGGLRGHTLLTHGEEEFQEQGLALSFSWEPNSSNRGPSLSMGHTMGATPSGGMDALLESTTMEGLDAAPSSGERFEAEMAYGFPAHDNQLTFTPAVGLAFSSTSRNYSLLWSLAPHSPQAQAGPWELSLEGERQEPTSVPSPVEHSLKLTFSNIF